MAANAEALLNLAHWAATGIETPMYASPEQRDADIETGAQRSPGRSAPMGQRVRSVGLATALDRLSADQWTEPGPNAPKDGCSPRPRSLGCAHAELMVHAVDLDPSLGFGDLPEDFLVALIEEVVAKRAAGGGHPALELRGGRRPGLGGPGSGRADTTARLGRRHRGLPDRTRGPELAASAAEPPALPPWL